MNSEQRYNAAYARARAGEACAAVVGVELLGVGVPCGIKDEVAYRNEIAMILFDLNQRAAEYDSDADYHREVPIDLDSTSFKRPNTWRFAIDRP